MTTKSLRRKPNNNNNNKNTSSSSSMALPATSSSSSNSKFKTVSVLISAVVFVSVLIILSISSNMRSAYSVSPNSDRIYTVEIVNEFHHDPYAFTQGLLYAGNDTLFESTGLHGESSVRKVSLRTGKVEVIHNMEYSYFGEGLTLLGDRLFQVNWLTKTGFIYDRYDLSKIKTFTNRMEDGWGLATDGKVLFGSDGTSTLYQIDPQTFKVVDKHVVKYKGQEVYNLNELEYVNGEVWANVWQSNCIARISTKDGLVLGWIYLPQLRKRLLAAGNSRIDVLNGIAWDQKRNRLFVTGKLWPKLYEIKVQPMTRAFNGDIGKLCMTPPVNFRKP